MAQTIPSGRVSPPAMNSTVGKGDRTKSPTPPAQPQSKRDKRRQMLSEKLSEITASFSANRKQHYQEQLRALEIDMNLILRAKPYAERPLEDDEEEVGDMISLVTGESSGPETQPRSVSSLAGKYYSQFADEVNTAMEDRDRDLTMTYNFYHNGLDELHKTNEYKIEMAHQEHAILCKTLRDRLISSVGHKRARLLREKEQLDIADSNALLLNPNQFSIANPASPSGGHGNRKTRNTRHRPGDADEVGASAAVTEGNGKRKRKVLHDDTENGSPAPLFRDAENGTATPLRDTKSKLVHSQYEAPLYSVDRLFTEKELSMTMNRAHMAAIESLAKKRAHEQNAKTGSSQGIPANGSHARNADNDAQEDPDAAASGTQSLHNNDVEVDSDAPAAFAAASPEPGQTSQVAHATRSSGRNIGLSDLATVAATIPPYAINISVAISKANPSAPPPAPLKEGEIREDWERMNRSPDDPRNEDLLEQACVKRVPIGTSMTQNYMQNDWTAEPGSHALEGDAAGLRAQAMARTTSGIGLGGVPMSKQSSMGGASEMGGVMMRRSVSAADFGAGTRGRAR